MDSVINYLDKYSHQILFLQVGIIFIVLAVTLWVYFSNRKKYQHLKHQIPATVVKSYLDSIIQNSTALKSSLFRGGGLDVDPNSIPSVMPLNDLSGAGMADSAGGDTSALNAQIQQLQSQLTAKQTQITDLESQNTDLSGQNKAKEERIAELEKMLEEAKSQGSAPAGDGASSEELAAVTKERDELKEKLAQYEIIEDDLANLKRLKQENEQLKKSLGGAAPAAAEAAPEPAAAEPAPTGASGEELDEEGMAMAAAMSEPAEPAQEAAPAPEAPPAPAASAEEDKSPEDLLSEFEKMLG